MVQRLDQSLRTQFLSVENNGKLLVMFGRAVEEEEDSRFVVPYTTSWLYLRIYEMMTRAGSLGPETYPFHIWTSYI